MNILIGTNFNANSLSNSRNRLEKKGFLPCNIRLSSLERDIVSFGAVKKNKLGEISKAMAEIFKPPLEKFNSEEELGRWTENRLEQAFQLEQYNTCHDEENEQRKIILEEWKKHLIENTLGRDFSKQEDNAFKLIIFSAITKKLKNNNRELPPLLHKKVFSNTVESIKNELSKDKKYRFNFVKQYDSNLKHYALKMIEQKITRKSGDIIWVKIPSFNNDPENFEENVLNLRILSHNNWCTKAQRAEEYLKKGDFHICLHNEKPRVAIRFEDNNLMEIQGVRNNKQVPILYVNETSNYIEDNKFRFEHGNFAKNRLTEAKNAKIRFDIARKELETHIENKDYAEVLGYFGIKSKKEDGMLIISFFKSPSLHFTYEDLGIDEDEMFKHIKKIEGRADFENSLLKNTGALQFIEGSAFFQNTQVERLENLVEIGGSAYFTKSRVTDLGKLKKIGHKADFEKSIMSSLGSLEEIGKDALLSKSKISDLGNLRKVGGYILVDRDIPGIFDVEVNNKLIKQI